LSNIQIFLRFKKLNSCTDFLLKSEKGVTEMFGLGKPRSKFGKFLDSNGISQQEVADKSGVSRGTISRLCQGDKFEPKIKNAMKIVSALRKITGKHIDYDDFWSM
jgi:putative transcriptional regulator